MDRGVPTGERGDRFGHRHRRARRLFPAVLLAVFGCGFYVLLSLRQAVPGDFGGAKLAADGVLLVYLFLQILLVSLAVLSWARDRASAPANPLPPPPAAPRRAFLIVPTRAEREISATLECAFRQEGFDGDVHLVVVLDAYGAETPADAATAAEVLAFLRRTAAAWGARVLGPAPPQWDVDDSGELLPYRLLATLHVPQARRTVVVYQKGNEGKSGCLNFAFRRIARVPESPGDFVVMIDSDSLLERSVLHHLDLAFRTREVDAVAGRVEVLNGDQNWLARCQAVEYFWMQQVYRKLQDETRSILVIPGPIFAVRRTLLRDHRLPRGPYEGETVVEDADLTAMLLVGKRRLALEPRAVSWSHVPTAVNLLGRPGKPSLWEQRKRWIYGQFQVFAKHWRALSAHNRMAFAWFLLLNLLYGFLGFLSFALVVLITAGAWWVHGAPPVGLVLATGPLYVFGLYLAVRWGVLAMRRPGFDVPLDGEARRRALRGIPSRGKLAAASLVALPVYEYLLNMMTVWLLLTFFVLRAPIRIAWRGRTWTLRPRRPYVQPEASERVRSGPVPRSFLTRRREGAKRDGAITKGKPGAVGFSPPQTSS